MHSCCQSRIGIVKKSFATREEALAACKRQRKRMPDKLFEPYACEVNRERFHIRTVRKRL